MDREGNPDMSPENLGGGEESHVDPMTPDEHDEYHEATGSEPDDDTDDDEEEDDDDDDD
jgi:hypothetical protein